MGLAVAKGIVEAHGGRIWIEDGREDRANRIAFTLPVGELNEMSSTIEKIDSLPAAAPGN